MDDIIENAKKIKAFEKIFVGLGKNKVIFKDLAKPEEHVTMLFTKDGRFDAHKTKEGSEKQYTPLGEFNLVEIIKDIASDPNAEERFAKELVQGTIKVNFEEPEFADYIILDFGVKDEFLKYVQKKSKDRIEIPPDPAVEETVRKFSVNWKDAKNRNLSHGTVMKGNDWVGLLFRFKDDYYFIPISTLMQTTIAKVIQNLTNITDNNDTEEQN